MSDNTAGPAVEVGVICERNDGDRRFILSKLNNDKFVRTGKQMIEDADFKIGFEAWQSNLADLWDEVQTLARAQGERVKRLAMIPRNGTVHIIFVTAGREFDFRLADELATLNIRLRRESQAYGDVEAAQIPEPEVSQFITEEELEGAVS